MTTDALDHLEQRFGVKLPASYRDYIATHGAGPMESHPDWYVELHSPETLAAVNQAPWLPPGLSLIGGDGSREHLALDFRRDPRPW